MDLNNQYTPQDRLYALGAQSARLYRVEGRIKASVVCDELESAMRTINRAYEIVERRFSSSPTVPVACEWLLDNRYTAEREAKLIRRSLRQVKYLRSCGEGAVLFLLCGNLVSSGSGVVTEERCRDFLYGFQSVTVLTHKELSLFSEALRCALLLRLASVCDRLIHSSDPSAFNEETAAIFTSFTALSSCDMRALCESADLTEQTLLKDPAGVYGSMDRQSRERYRDRLSALAKRCGMQEHEYAEALVKRAEENGVHIGSLLFRNEKRGRGSLYIAANLLLTLSLSLLCGFLSKSPAAALLLLLPVSELTKSLLDYVILLCVKPCFLPRLELSGGIPEEGRSLCVLSVLLTSPDAASDAAKHLEEISLLNRDGSGNLSFGILADLPEAATAVTDKDAAVLAALKTELCALNTRYGGGFYLFTRPRRDTDGSGIFRGFERKRGAVLALASLLCGEDSELRVTVGNAKSLHGTRYIITLDSDTVPAPDSLRELIGAALHPLNKCVLNRAAGKVVSGFGIFTPRIGVELDSVYANDFSRIFAGPGGTEPYSGLSGEVYMDLFRSGGFFGKGLIDAEALLVCSKAHIPQGEILSHDALEGAYLYGAYMSDIEFCDAFPPNPLSYYRRLHRWIRGDWQNAPMMLSRHSGLTDIDRFKLFDSLRRSLVSPMIFVSVFAGLAFSSRGLTLALTAALLSIAVGAIISLTEALSERRRKTRYHSHIAHGVGLSLMRSFIRLWLLPYEAWISVSAIGVSLWRMLVSGKNLLQWETSAQSGAKSRSLFSYPKNMWFAVLSGLALVFLSASVTAKAAGLMWFFSPLALYALSLPCKGNDEISDADKSYLLGIARDTWAYFSTFCTVEDNYLPPDNCQTQPPVGTAHRTSPTNIGLALCSAICAMDLGIDRGNAPELIENMLGTLERMPKKYGHFYNWYDTGTLRPLHPKYLSTVDCGNLLACLIAVKNGLCEHRFFVLAKRVEALIAPMDLSLFYDPTRELMLIGIDAEKDLPSPAHYDLMASEARLTSYLAVAKGDVPKKHWQALSRAMRRYGGYTGMASWTGTMFEYLMPELFLPLFRNSLMFETAKYCVFVQRHRRSPSGIWGISESAFFSLDPSLCYRYKAHGCSALALKRGQDSELVISPYSSFLALAVAPKAALRNIRRMEAHGLRGRFGFTEALDLTPSRCRSAEGEQVRTYMAHHLGMTLLAVANLIDDNAVVRRMLDEPYIRAYRGLLCEKLPVLPVVLDLPEKESDEPISKPRPFYLRGESFDFMHPHCCLLSNGSYSIMSTETALTASRMGEISVYASPLCPAGEGHGTEIGIITEKGEVSLLPEADATYLSSMWELGDSSCAFSLETPDFYSKCSVAVSGACNGEIRFVELEAKEDIGAAEIFLSFEPVLAVERDYVNHPAYWRLGLIAENVGGCLMLRRLPRGRQKELWLCLACDREMDFSADSDGSVGVISKPLVRLSHKTKLKSGQRISLRFGICLADSRDAAFEGAQMMLATGPSEYGAMVSAYAAALKLDARQTASAMENVFPLHFFMRKNVFCAKEDLWKYGISGDRPIVMCPSGMTRDDIGEAVRRHCLLAACGLSADLIFLSDEGGDYYRPVYSAVRDTLCAFGLDALLGEGGSIRILPESAEPVICSCASVIVGEDKDSNRINAKPSFPKKHIRSKDHDIEYAFSDDGTFNCYVNHLPPRVWCNVLTNGTLSYLAADNGCGNMWYKNAREMQISPWRNDPSGAYPAETLEYISGERRFSLFAADDGVNCRMSFGFGYTRWERSDGETSVRCTAFIPPDTDARVFIVEMCGEIGGQIAWKLPLQMGGEYVCKNAVSVSYVNSAFEASSARSSFPVTFRATFGCAPLQIYRDLESWQTGSEAPDDVGSYPVFAAVLPAAPVSVIVCGVCEPELLLELCKPESAIEALERTKSHWKKAVSVLHLKSADQVLDRFMSGWGLYQSLACRIHGRCSIYQSGGATGFRDQLQDAVNLIFADPSIAREQIIICCAHQYAEGDVMHWWHSLPDGDKGVRTRCSDDLLWLVWALCEYVEKTGDCSVCDEGVYYVNSLPLSDSESDRYETPSRSEICESVLMHCKRAIDCVTARGTGMHGLLLFGSGDWNDGMDRVRGESVWLSWFFAHTVRRFADLLLMLCKLEPDCYRAKAKEIGTMAEATWDGEWYLRGYWPDGTPLGSKRNLQCRIDSISQSWAAFCPDASNSHVDLALDSALNALYDRELGIVKLFTPPFLDPEHDPGYIASYGEGFRENGGQYTHAAIWLASACLRRGRERDGASILHDLLPAAHDVRLYEAEPFVIPADVYSAVGHAGEAGWTWYTGSAGWFLRVVTEDLLGLKLYAGKLYIRPHLPDGFAACHIRFGGRDIRISPEEILVDGEKYDGKGIAYPK